MPLSLLRRASPLLAVALWAACGAPAPPPSGPTTVVRPLGAWQGSGTRTMGDVNSTSGRFRIHWEAREDAPGVKGRFTLTVRSAVSGRPLEVVADHEGNGQGAVDFSDDPRVYDFLVESTGVQWSFRVEETYTQP